MDAAQVARLINAASGQDLADLLSAVAAEAGGWAVLLDPLGEVVAAAPASAGPPGQTAAASSNTAGVAVIARASGAQLVIAARTEADREVADLASDLLAVRGTAAEEVRAMERDLHAMQIRLLLHGRSDLARLVQDLPPRATVYRLGGSCDVNFLHRAVWLALRPWTQRARSTYLMGPYEHALALVVLDPDAEGRIRSLAARAAKRYGALGGISGQLPVRMLGAGWLEASQAQALADSTVRLMPAAGLGTLSLTRCIPPDRLAAWTHALLAPLDLEQQIVLGTWLETGGSVSRTAHTLGLSRGTVRTRLDHTAAALGADLDRACVRSRLLLALLLDEDGHEEATDPPVPVNPSQDCLVWTMDLAEARAWAKRLLESISYRRRKELETWLEHHARTAPAARHLGISRATLDRHVHDASETLGADLSPRVRAELHLALLTARVTAPGGERPPGAPDHGDWLTRGQQHP